MYQGKKVSVVFSTYREKNSIRQAIEDYFATGYVDEVIVVNNNAEPGTDEEVRKTKATLVYESRQGSGFGYRRGIKEANGDYIFLSEPDGTFVAPDLERFLVYSKNYPVVFGTRTNQSAILEGAAMGLARKLANVFEAKLLEVLFGTNSITDVGCICKLVKKEALQEIQPYFRQGGGLFATEILLLVIAKKIPFIEIPISFQVRSGKSSLTQYWYQLSFWGIRILLFILFFWIRWLAGGLKSVKL